MNKPTTLAKAIKIALFTSMSSTLISIPAFAEETSASESVERIAVLGSRVSTRTITDSAVPVDRSKFLGMFLFYR